MTLELNDTSPVIGQPKQIIKSLTKYQKAILYKALIEIENQDKKFGFLGDKPGIGKTAVILALIAASKSINNFNQTIIVVPLNILHQWEKEIEKFCGKNLTFIKINSYAVCREFYDEDDRNYYKTFDIILTTSSTFKLLKDIMNECEYNVKRVVFDEVDTIENLFDTMAIADTRDIKNKNKIYKSSKKQENFSDITWYVSASVINLLDEDDNFTLGNLKLTKQEFTEHYIKCSDEFIKCYSLINCSTIKQEIKCESIIDKFKNILSVEQFDFINSLSFNQIKGEYTNKSAKNEEDTILIIVEDYYIHHKNLLEEINNKKEQIEKFKKRNRKYDDLETELNKDEAEEKFYLNCLQNFYDIYSVYSFKDFQEKYKEDVLNFKEDLCKKMQIFKYIQSLKNQKTIIFSDFTSGFNLIIDFFDTHKIKYTDLSKGNIVEIVKAIDNYKNKDFDFLLIDSALEGCGLNLENTNEIIFIHRTNETLYEQMIGRALRPGRIGDLKVTLFLNVNEIVDN